jgi:hypothetical protein
MSGTTVNANVVIPFPFEFPYLVDNANGVNFELFIFEVPNHAAVGPDQWSNSPL